MADVGANSVGPRCGDDHSMPFVECAKLLGYGYRDPGFGGTPVTNMIKYDPLIAEIILESGGGTLKELYPENDNYDALAIAAEKGQLKIVQLLMKNANTRSKSRALQMASISGHKDIVELLFDNGADIHWKKDIALHGAAMMGHFEIVKFLLSKGANASADRSSALSVASKNGRIEIVQLLLEHRANVHGYNDFALRLAAENGHVEIVQLLVSYGARLPNKYVYWDLNEYAQEVFFRTLMKAGEKNRFDSATNEEILLFAAVNGYNTIIRLLMESSYNTIDVNFRVPPAEK